MYHWKTRRGLGDAAQCPPSAPNWCANPADPAGNCCPSEDCSQCVTPAPQADQGVSDCIDYGTAYALALGSSTCAPTDQSCVTGRQQAVDDFNEFWESTPGNCHTADQIPVYQALGTNPIAPATLGVSVSPAAPSYASSGVPAPAAAPKPYASSAAPAGGTPPGTTVIQANTAAAAPSENDGMPATSGFSLASIPTWGWIAAAAALALVAFKR